MEKDISLDVPVVDERVREMIDRPLRIDRLIGRVSDLYPYGIPKPVLEEAKKRHSAVLASRKRVLFLVASASLVLSTDEELLLESIVQKGLALTKDEVSIAVCDLSTNGKELSGWIKSSMRDTPSIVTVLMGFQQSSHGSWTEGNSALLHTVSLAEVHSSKESKRLFWGHLQGVIARVKEAR